jgi:hypothetical protein
MLTICNIWTRSLTFIVGASFDKFNVALQFGGLSEFIILITIVKHLQVANGSSPLVCFQLVYWNIKCTWQYNNLIRSTICYILSWIGFNVSFTLKLILAFDSSKVDPTRGGWRCIDSLFEERPLPYCSILNTTTCVSIAITKRRWFPLSMFPLRCTKELGFDKSSGKWLLRLKTQCEREFQSANSMVFCGEQMSSLNGLR